MLHELTPEQYSRATPLFVNQLNIHLFCAGVLAGTAAGQVIVDDVNAPQNAVVIKGGSWCYMAGANHDRAFSQALQKELVERQIVPEQIGALLLAPPDEQWQSVMGDLVPERQPIPTPRTLYMASNDYFHANPQLDEPFSLHFMDESLRNKVVGDLPGDVETVLQMRNEQDRPDEAAFGFVVLHEDDCVAHAMVDCVVADRGEIGLFTKDAFRQQGLGLATAAATIDYGLQNGLTYIHWDCRSSNTGSVRLAERLGLDNVHSYTQYVLIFNEVGYLVNWGFAELDAGHYPETLGYCAKMLQSEDEVMLSYGHFLAGAAQAGINEHERAIDHLQKAAAHGFVELAELKTRSTLHALQERPQWPSIVAAVRKNLSK